LKASEKIILMKVTYLITITHHIVQCEASTAEAQNTDPIPIYHYRTWRNPTMPNMILTQQEQVASYTCNNQQNTVLPNNIQEIYQFTTNNKKHPNRVNHQFNLQNCRYKQFHSQNYPYFKITLKLKSSITLVLYIYQSIQYLKLSKKKE
jgi:predicted transglutaminase-like cysteine proteinase